MNRKNIDIFAQIKEHPIEHNFLTLNSLVSNFGCELLLESTLSYDSDIANIKLGAIDSNLKNNPVVVKSIKKLEFKPSKRGFGILTKKKRKFNLLENQKLFVI